MKNKAGKSLNPNYNYSITKFRDFSLFAIGGLIFLQAKSQILK